MRRNSDFALKKFRVGRTLFREQPGLFAPNEDWPKSSADCRGHKNCNFENALEVGDASMLSGFQEINRSCQT